MKNQNENNDDDDNLNSYLLKKCTDATCPKNLNEILCSGGFLH